MDRVSRRSRFSLPGFPIPFVWALAAWAVSMGIVIYFSLLPNLQLPVHFWKADKFAHLFAYAWLSALPMIGFPRRGFALSSSLCLIGLGLLLEMAQAQIPGRTFSLGDMAANGLGVFFGALGGYSLRDESAREKTDSACTR